MIRANENGSRIPRELPEMVQGVLVDAERRMVRAGFFASAKPWEVRLFPRPAGAVHHAFLLRKAEELRATLRARAG